MDLGIKGKLAMVHGAGGGLGSAVALAMLAEGATVLACDINADALENLKTRAHNSKGTLHTRQWDLSQVDQFKDWHQEIVKTLGPIEILFNNTGGPPPSLVHNVDRQEWEKHFQSMVLSVIAMTDLVLEGMKNNRWGRIITSASSGVVAPIPNLGLSNTLRSALVGWSKTLAREVGEHGITSNVIIPGRIATQRIIQLDEAKAERENRAVDSVVKESTSSIPLKRYGKPEEYGAAATFLASKQAAYITGTIMRVDGGLIAAV